MDKGTKNALLYTAGVAAVYLGYKHYKKMQGLVQKTTPSEQLPATKTIPSGPTFGNATSLYLKKIQTLQSLLAVKTDGLIGPITIKAGQAAGINYKITAANIDKAIAQAQSFKNKPSSFFTFINRK